MTTKNSPYEALRAQAVKIVRHMRNGTVQRVGPNLRFAIGMDGTSTERLSIKTATWTWAFIDLATDEQLIEEIIKEMRK